MTTITINLPEQLAKDQDDVKRFLAAKLYESGKLTLSQGAQMSDLPTREFAEILVNYNVSLLNYPVSEMVSDAEKI